MEYDTNKHSPPVHWRQNARKKKISPSLETESKKTKQKDMLNRTKTTARRDRVKLQLAESFLKKKIEQTKGDCEYGQQDSREDKEVTLCFIPQGFFPTLVLSTRE